MNKKIRSLLGVLVVERETARTLMDGDGGNGDVYVAGRVGAYDFAIDRVLDRWPELRKEADEMTTRIRDSAMTIEPPPE